MFLFLLLLHRRLHHRLLLHLLNNKSNIFHRDLYIMSIHNGAITTVGKGYKGLGEG